MMANNDVFWLACGIMVVLAAVLLVIWRELKKIYYRSLSYRETLDKRLAEAKREGEEIIGKIGQNSGELKVVEEKVVELKREILEEIKVLREPLSLFETKFDKGLAELKREGEEIIGKIGQNSGELKVVEEKVVELKSGILEEIAALKEHLYLFETKFDAIKEALDQGLSDVHSLEGKMADVREGVMETRYNDFLNYSLRLVEEAKAKACIKEKLYNTLLELFHNLKVDHYLK